MTEQATVLEVRHFLDGMTVGSCRKVKGVMVGKYRHETFHVEGGSLRGMSLEQAVAAVLDKLPGWRSR